VGVRRVSSPERSIEVPALWAGRGPTSGSGSTVTIGSPGSGPGSVGSSSTSPSTWVTETLSTETPTASMLVSGWKLNRT
jgi:hypothetical protein